MKHKSWTAFVSCLILLGGVLSVCATEVTNRTWVPLASEKYRVGTGKCQLSLFQEGLLKPGQTGFSWDSRNVIFKLEREGRGAAGSAATQPVILWVGYEFFWPRSAPWPTWSGAIVADEAKKVVYLAWVRSLSVGVSVRLYTIDPEKPAPSLPQYDENGKLKDIKTLLEGAQVPISEFKKSFHTSCGIASVQMKIEGQKLRLTLIRNECETTQLSYDLTSEAWSEDPPVGDEKGK